MVRIIFIAGREPQYIRNAIILKSLGCEGIDVINCTSISKSYMARYLEVIFKFILNKRSNFDIVFIGFFGQPLVPIIRMITDKPIIFDAFLSAYDTMCFDRKKFRPDSIFGKFFYWMDKTSCNLSNIVLLDTFAHMDYFAKTFGLNSNNLRTIYVGADESVFFPVPINKDYSKFVVFYYSTYLPLHGIEYIVKAAKLLEKYKEIEFQIMGTGIEYSKIIKLSDALNIHNIKYIDGVSINKFNEIVKKYIANADVCLGGHFSNSDKGKRVIAGKTFEFIAMKKPVIVGDNPANRELFEDKKNALFVEHANSDALANAILELKDNEELRKRIAEDGYKTFKERCTPELIGKDINRIMAEMLVKQVR